MGETFRQNCFIWQMAVRHQKKLTMPLHLAGRCRDKALAQFGIGFAIGMKRWVHHDVVDAFRQHKIGCIGPMKLRLVTRAEVLSMIRTIQIVLIQTPFFF